MKRRIQRSMAFILCLTLCLAILSFSYVIFDNNVKLMKTEVRKEVLHISQGINYGGIEFLEGILEEHSGSRITLIDKDGTVVIDTSADPRQLENHLNRGEVSEAVEKGMGQEIRTSDSLGTQTFYYAVRLENEQIIRVSRTTQSVYLTVLDLMPTFLLVGFLVFILAIFLSRKETYKMIQPLNDLDLDEPFNSKMYEELRPLLERIDMSNKSKEEAETLRREFSANVSHELKTPLTSISGYAELMKSGLVKHEDIVGFAEKIYTEASRMKGLIEDIIRISQLDEKGIQMEKSELDVYYVMRDICSRLSYPVEKKKVQLTLTGGSGLINAVPTVLEEMLYNIADNALKYNVVGGKVDIWVGTTLEGVRVIIKDTGIGIPKEEQERIFERFYRVDKSHSKETGGSGLGLSIVKHAARLHDAQITLDSVLGEGTKVTIDFMNKSIKNNSL